MSNGDFSSTFHHIFIDVQWISIEFSSERRRTPLRCGLGAMAPREAKSPGRPRWAEAALRTTPKVLRGGRTDERPSEEASALRFASIFMTF